MEEQATEPQKDNPLTQALLLLCPNCLRGFPFVSLKPTDEVIHVIIQCSCLNYPQHLVLKEYLARIANAKARTQECLVHNKQSNKYCLDCIQWHCDECINNHPAFAFDNSLSDFELLIVCLKHKKSFSHYCMSCHGNICNECLNSHTTHSITPLKAIDNIQSLQKTHEEVMLKNKETVELFSKAIDKQINMPQISENSRRLQFKQEDIRSSFQSSLENNKAISSFISCLIHTSELYCKYPSYQSMTLHRSLTIAKPYDYNANEPITNTYISLKQYFLNEFQLKAHFQLNSTITVDTNYITNVLELPDGQLVSYSKENTIKLWNLKTGECNGTLSGHSDNIKKVKLLKDGQLVSWSQDKVIKLWNISTCVCNGTLTGHCKEIIKVKEISNAQLASCSHDITIKLWNITTYTCIRTLAGHTNYIRNILELKEGQLVSCSDDTTIKVWSTASTQCVNTFQGHSTEIINIKMLKSKQLISYSHSIKLWQKNLEGCIFTTESHNGYINNVRELNDGRLVSYSEDRAIKLWDVTSGKCICTLEGHRNFIVDVFELENGLLLSCSFDRTIKVWNTVIFQCVCTITGPPNLVRRVVQLRNGNLLAYYYDTIRLLEKGYYQCKDMLFCSPLYLPFILKDGRLGICSGYKETIELWEML